MEKKILTKQQSQVLADAIAYYFDKPFWTIPPGERDKEYITLRKVIKELDLPDKLCREICTENKILTEAQSQLLADVIAYYLDKYIWDDTGEHDDEYFTVREVINELELRGKLPDWIIARF